MWIRSCWNDLWHSADLRETGERGECDSQHGLQELTNERFIENLKNAEQRGENVIASVDATIVHVDRFLFIQLLGLVQGEYLDVILEAPFGFEAWRKLCMELRAGSCWPSRT